MKILHTSDWHIGRTFHTHSTLEHLRIVLDAMVEVVRERDVDVVIVAGDVFDSSMPSAEAFTVLSGALRTLRAAGAQLVLTSGNHDSATRLGFQSEWAGLAGIHVVTEPGGYSTPITIDDRFGPVHFYGIPYLEPALVRHLHPEAELRTHEQVVGFAMDVVRADLAQRGGRSIAISHVFAAEVAARAEATDVERDITAGGLNLVPASVFDGPDYVALGHIHGRSTITERVRYSGAPLHYSFSEAGKPRGGWLVELDADGLKDVEWIDLPVPRTLTVLTGDLADLLGDRAHDGREDDWISAVLTDRVRPMDGMRRLQARFPHAIALEHRPSVTAESAAQTYSERVRAKTDREVVDGFLEHVRNGVGPSEFESTLIDEIIGAGE
jgi:exonuclease SbcD